VKEQKPLRDCSAIALLEALNDIGIQTLWLQEDPELAGWETRPLQVEELMIGDTEYEVRCPSFSLPLTCRIGFWSVPHAMFADLRVVCYMAEWRREIQRWPSCRGLRKNKPRLGSSAAKAVPCRL
jgi:hypothetical protein